MRFAQFIALTGMLSAVAAGGPVAAEGKQFHETVTVRGGRTSLVGGANSHVLTFSGPVALPGVALGAGTYVFKRPEPRVLLVFATDGRPLAMVNTGMATRTEGTQAYQVVLRRAPRADAPARIEAWFAAGETYGQQLVYGNR